MPVTPAASAVRMIVPRFPGDSMDSTASQSPSAAKAVSILIACGAPSRLGSGYGLRGHLGSDFPFREKVCQVPVADAFGLSV